MMEMIHRQVTDRGRDIESYAAEFVPLSPTRADRSPSPGQSQPSRNAFTLIELVTVMGFVGLIITGTLSLLTLMRQEQDQSNQQLLSRRDLVRWIGDVRRDVRMAETVSLDDAVFTIKHDDGSVIYRSEHSGDGLLVSRIQDVGRKDSYTIRASELPEVSWDDTKRQLSVDLGPYSFIAMGGK